MGQIPIRLDAFLVLNSHPFGIKGVTRYRAKTLCAEIPPRAEAAMVQHLPK